MATADIKLTAENLRRSLNDFWDENLKIEATRNGFLLTMPAAFPDGWQMVLEVEQLTPKGLKISDRGQTLSWLSDRGQNIDTEAMKGHIQECCESCFIERDHWELYRWVETPLEPVDLHVFAEGMVNISQLFRLHDPHATEQDVASEVVQKVFQDAHVEAKRNAKLTGTAKRQIRVDYLVQPNKPVAFKLIKSQHDFSGNMEKWGFRWQGIRKVTPSLMPVMLYDRNIHLIDPYSQKIGEQECELFCGYDETDRIHEVPQKSEAVNDYPTS